MHSDYWSYGGGLYFGTDEGSDLDGTCLYLGTEPEPEEGYQVHNGAGYYEDDPSEDELDGEYSTPQISPETPSVHEVVIAKDPESGLPVEYTVDIIKMIESSKEQIVNESKETVPSEKIDLNESPALENSDVTEPENPYSAIKFTFTSEDPSGYLFTGNVHSTVKSEPNPLLIVSSETTMNSCFFDFLSPNDGTGIPSTPQKCDHIPYDDIVEFLATVEMPENKDFGDVPIPDRLVIPLGNLTDPTHLTEKLNKTICQFTQTLRGVFEIDNQTFFYRATLGLDKPYEAIVAVSIASNPIAENTKVKHRKNQYDITVLVFALRNEAHDSHFISLVGEVYLNLIPDQTDQKLSTLVVDSALCIEPIVIMTTETDLIRYVRQIFADMTLFGAPLVSTD